MDEIRVSLYSLGMSFAPPLVAMCLRFNQQQSGGHRGALGMRQFVSHYTEGKMEVVCWDQLQQGTQGT